MMEQSLRSCHSAQSVLCDSDPGETGSLGWVEETEVDSHCVQDLGLQEEKMLLLEMESNTQEEVCWGRKVDGASRHEESRAASVTVVRVLVLEETRAIDGVEAAESRAAGKHPMTRAQALQQNLHSVPYSVEAQVDVVNNDTAAVCPFSHSSPASTFYPFY